MEYCIEHIIFYFICAHLYFIKQFMYLLNILLIFK